MKPSGETTVNRTTGDGLATSPTLEPYKKPTTPYRKRRPTRRGDDSKNQSAMAIPRGGLTNQI